MVKAFWLQDAFLFFTFTPFRLLKDFIDNDWQKKQHT